jgi:aminocarboxymuconate-semialdehyde decarboxylase
MFYADTAEFGALAPTRCGLDFFGVDHVLFASDCPYEPESGLYVRETFGVMRQLGLPEADLAKIHHGNAMRLMPGLTRPDLTSKGDEQPPFDDHLDATSPKL